jgi:hypothetical protein
MDDKIITKVLEGGSYVVANTGRRDNECNGGGGEGWEGRVVRIGRAGWGAARRRAREPLVGDILDWSSI